MNFPDPVLTEARAHIIWGEPPVEVLAGLRSRGLGEKSARTLLTRLVAERTLALRQLTLAKIIHGVLLLFSPVAASFLRLLAGLFFGDSESLLAVLSSILLGVLFDLTFGLAIIGLWKIVNGLCELLRPSPTLDLSHFEE